MVPAALAVLGEHLGDRRGLEARHAPGSMIRWLAAAQALMVGDTEYDMEMARRAGVPAIGVRSGAHEAFRLQRHAPVIVLDGVGQITGGLARR